MTRGSAIVWLRSGYCYEGTAEIHGPWVNFTGRRRLVVGDEVQYRRACAHTWPWREVRAVRWLGETAVAR